MAALAADPGEHAEAAAAVLPIEFTARKHLQHVAQGMAETAECPAAQDLQLKLLLYDSLNCL